MQLPDLVILPEPGSHRQTEQGGTDRRGDEQRDERGDDGRSPPLGDALLAGDRTREVGKARTPGVRARPGGLATVEIRPSLMGVSSSQPDRVAAVLTRLGLAAAARGGARRLHGGSSQGPSTAERSRLTELGFQAHELVVLRHDRCAGAPVLIWPQFVATAKSAIVVSSVSPLRWLITEP